MGSFPFDKLRVRMTTETGNGSCNSKTNGRPRQWLA